jgi:hydrogenase expression/formation protein HypD
MGVWMLVQQIQKGESFVQNEYTRVVHKEGNVKAQQTMQKVFEPLDIKWRGFPEIPQSGLALLKDFKEYDARKKFADDLDDLKDKKFEEPEGCKCGELLRGLASPLECPLFGQGCTPDTPVGPCMVSIEGCCNIEYRYSKK